MLDVKGVVYSIPCADCPAIYIGETGRTLKVHMEEHKRAVKSKDPLKELPCTSRRLHITSTGKRLESLQGENNWGKRRVHEALKINLDAGLLLDQSWTPIVCPRSRNHETGSVLAGSPNPI